MTTTKQGAGGYDLEGTLLAACSCPVPCPRWIGTDPNGGPCDAVHVYHLERGTIRGVDVSGLTAVLVVRSPGGQVVRFIDEQASDKQLAAILDAYRGKLGGPLGGPGLVADELAVERVEIVAEIRGGKAEARIGDVVTIAMAPAPAGTAARTTLRDPLFPRVPLSTAYLGRADNHRVNLPQYGMVWSFQGRTAVHAPYHISHSAAPEQEKPMESMKPSLSRTYVLVHGSFVGAWCWSRVVPELEAAGHEVHAPALTGVGERADEATPQVGLLAHIDQITRLIEANDLRDVVLVGHSYGGMVVAGVACRVPERIAGIVYVDAFVPKPGQSCLDILPYLRDAFAGLVLPERPWLFAPFPLEALGVDDPELREWAEPQLTPMLWKAVEERLPADAGDLSKVPTVFIHFARGQFFDDTAIELRSRGIPVLTLDEGHMAHLTNPKRLAALLIEAEHELGTRTGSHDESSLSRS